MSASIPDSRLGAVSKERFKDQLAFVNPSGAAFALERGDPRTPIMPAFSEASGGPSETICRGSVEKVRAD